MSEVEVKYLFQCQTGHCTYKTADEDWVRFDQAACAAGHSSGWSAAKDCNLWEMTVDDAIEYVLQAGEADPDEWSQQIGSEWAAWLEGRVRQGSIDTSERR